MTAAAAVAEGAALASPELLPLHGRGFVAIPAEEITKLSTVARATGVVAVWAVLRMEASRRGGHSADLPRRWVAERITAAAATVDAVKKVPGKVAALTDAAVCIAVVDNPHRVRVEFPRHRAGGPGAWTSRLRGHDLDRILDPADPMGWADLVPWLRWQQVMRLDEVWVTQAELARRWNIDARTVRREQARLVELGLLAVERQPGGLCRYWAAELDHRGQIRILGADTARWIRHDGDETDPTQEVPGDPSGPVFSGLGGPDTTGTRSGHNWHRQHSGTLSPRARVQACALHPGGTSVPPVQSPVREPARPASQSTAPDPHRTTEGGEASPRHQGKTSSRDLAWRQALRIVRSQRWLMTGTESVRWGLVATIARFLRRQLPGVTPASLTAAIAQIDPGEHTTSHVALIRQAVSGLIADAKAAPAAEPARQPARPRQRPVPATPVSDDGANEALVQSGGNGAMVVDPAWAAGPVPAEPRWHRTDPDDPAALRWLATLFLRRPSLRPVTIQRRLPPHWHTTVQDAYDRTRLAVRAGR